MVQMTVFIACLALGSVWNCLCLFGVLSLPWQASLIPVCLGGLFVLILRMLSSRSRKRGESRRTREQEEEEKALAAACVIFLVTWALTAAACLVNLP